jgi:hypothetical protein
MATFPASKPFIHAIWPYIESRSISTASAPASSESAQSPRCRPSNSARALASSARSKPEKLSRGMEAKASRQERQSIGRPSARVKRLDVSRCQAVRCITSHAMGRDA